MPDIYFGSIFILAYIARCKQDFSTIPKFPHNEGKIEIYDFPHRLIPVITFIKPL